MPASHEGPLTPEEWELWRGWKRAQEVVRARVVSGITAATGLSDPDFGVLARVDEEGGVIRQNRLATLMGWHRSRLSHQLTRMEERGWITRRAVPGGVEVVLSDTGREAVGMAWPIHAAGVRRHLAGLFTDTELAQLRDALRRINGDGSADDDASG